MELYSYDGFIRILNGLSSLRANIILYLTVPNNEIRPVNCSCFANRTNVYRYGNGRSTFKICIDIRVKIAINNFLA